MTRIPVGRSFGPSVPVSLQAFRRPRARRAGWFAVGFCLGVIALHVLQQVLP